MRHLEVRDKIAELGVHCPAWPVFTRIGDLTKLRAEGSGFRRVNYESGPLLYALVRHHRPRRILEIGTGRGYGAFCMALALEDAGLDGQVVTVDVKRYDEPQNWALDDGSGPRVATLSRRDVWERHFDPRLRERILQVQGTSFRALEQLAGAGEQVDFVYIDGDHTYPVVRHDFYASLLLARPPFRILLDDYTPLSHLYGVRRLVDREIAPTFEVEAVHTEGRWDASAAGPLAASDQAQVLVDSERVRRPVEHAFPPERVQKIVRRHRRWPGLLSRMDAIRTAAMSVRGRR